MLLTCSLLQLAACIRACDCDSAGALSTSVRLTGPLCADVMLMQLLTAQQLGEFAAPSTDQWAQLELAITEEELRRRFCYLGPHLGACVCS